MTSLDSEQTRASNQWSSFWFFCLLCSSPPSLTDSLTRSALWRKLPEEHSSLSSLSSSAHQSRELPPSPPPPLQTLHAQAPGVAPSVLSPLKADIERLLHVMTQRSAGSKWSSPTPRSPHSPRLRPRLVTSPTWNMRWLQERRVLLLLLLLHFVSMLASGHEELHDSAEQGQCSAAAAPSAPVCTAFCMVGCVLQLAINSSIFIGG